METASIRGVSVPKIGIGTWRMDDETARRTVSTALDLGYRHVDTAQMYENERGVGRGIQDADVARDDVFLATKVNPLNRHFDSILESVESSLQRLAVDHLDLLLIHWPNPLADLETVMAALDEARDRGYTRHIGVSNFGRDRLKRARELASSPVYTDQVQLHPFWPQQDLLEYARENDTILTGYSPLAHGGLLNDDVLETIGRRYDKTPAQVALRWAIGHENVIAIPKSTSPAHLRENLEVFDFELTATERRDIARPSKLRTASLYFRQRLGI